jgi:hypothetical protein
MVRAPSWIPGHARRHERTDKLDIHWMPSYERGWTFQAKSADFVSRIEPHGYHLDKVHAARTSAGS